MAKFEKIEVVFPFPVEAPPGFFRLLDALVGMVCKKYEAENPDRSMWVCGQGARPIFREPHEPEFDHSAYYMEIFEREASDRVKERRRQAAEANRAEN